MSAGSKLSILLVVLLLSFGLVACGDDDSGSGGGDAAAQNEQQAAEAGDDRASGGGGDPAAGEGDGADAAEGEDDGGSAPRQHDDSGGGSQQLLTPGGDNSVQEFGSEASDEEREEAAAAVHGFLDTRAQGDWDAACSYVSGDVRESLEELASRARDAADKQGESVPEETDCASTLAALSNQAVLPQLRKEAAAADVRSLRAEGEKGFVLYTNGKKEVIAIPVVKEDEGWKVGSLAGTPLT